MTRQFLCVALGVALGAGGYAAADHAKKDAPGDALKQKVVLEQALAEKVDGREAKVTLIELERAPGTAGAKHRHPGPVVVYVLDGELESQVGDGPVKTYKKGESFYEPAGALHAVSRNPSKEKPARFLAFFLTAKDVKELVIPEKP
jgi:quercetin dioxygenase-like cupin family protein